MKRLCAALMLWAACGHAAAEQRFLVPIHLIEPVQGDFGSLWASELTVLNTGPVAAHIENYGQCAPNAGPCIYAVFPGAAETGTEIRGLVFGYGIPAALLIVDDRYADQFVFSARVRDLSRSAQNWGAWLPVVPEAAAVRGPVTLLDIPISGGFRQALRVYSFDVAPGRSVRVRIYGAVPPDPFNPATYLDPNPLLAELRLPLRYAAGASAMPLYAEIVNLAAVPTITGHDKVWVVVEPEGAFGVWAMASVTNNTTQEITMILPHRAD